MAIEMNPMLVSSTNWRHQPITRTQISLNRLIYISRRIMQHLTVRKRSISTEGSFPFPVWAEDTRKKFGGFGYVFVPDIFATASHLELVTNFPSKRFLNPKSDPIKSYDFGFRYLANQGEPFNEIRNIGRFPTLSSLYEMLLSSQFSESVTELCGDGVERACYSIVCSRASSGSILIPHKDTVAGSTSNDRENFINIIFFVDANGPEGAELGATGIYRDNQFAEPILIPPTLKNSALIYKSSADFFHGFPKMDRRTSRITVNAQFARKGTTL